MNEPQQAIQDLVDVAKLAPLPAYARGRVDQAAQVLVNHMNAQAQEIAQLRETLQQADPRAGDDEGD